VNQAPARKSTRTASHARLGSSWIREDGLGRVAQRVAHDMAAHLTGALADARAR